jgi:hypothetical protein
VNDVDKDCWRSRRFLVERASALVAKGGEYVY